MFKKAALTLAAVGLLAGSAVAANLDINIYGASAQYKFWGDVAPDFLKQQGCTETGANAITHATGKINEREHYVATCNNGTDQLTIRVTGHASATGVRSVQDISDPAAQTYNGCVGATRDMADPTAGGMSAAFDGSGTKLAAGSLAGTACVDVTVGASDVAAETFNQESHGTLDGPFGGTYADLTISGLTVDTSATGNFNQYRPVVVPFSFFVNNGWDGGDRENGGGAAATAVPVSNLSRLQAVALYSGQVKNWNQFDSSYPSLETVICVRHAGSGTHATLDAAVMRGDASLLTKQAFPGDFGGYDFFGQPETYFMESSSDLMACVGRNEGAVGYADSDKISVDANYEFSKTAADPKKKAYGKVKKIKYQGFYAERDAIMNGNYNFWAAQWLYAKKSETTALKNFITALDAFASNPTNLANSGKAGFWAAQGEMNVGKTTDFDLPVWGN